MQPKSPPNPGRRKFLIGATSAVGAVGIAGAAVPFISAFNPSAAAEAAGAPAIADISKLAPGEMIIVEWRGTPIYVCLLYTSPSPQDLSTSRMPSSA